MIKKKKKPALKRSVRFKPTAELNTFHNDDSEVLVVQLHGDHSRLPTQATHKAAGCDLYAAEAITIGAWKNCAVSTGISIVSFPKNCYGRIAGRSGLALHHNLLVGAGVIDRDYTGILKVVLFNFSDQPYVVSIGDRIAQLLCEVYIRPTIEPHNIRVPINHIDCDCVVRGANGFGSTGGQC